MTRKLAAIFTFSVMFAVTAAHHWGYFDLSKDISRVAVAPGEFDTDLTPQFGTASILWEEALARGSVAHWNPYILGGTPNLSNGQSRFISIENLLNFFLRGQVSTRLSIPIQILIGWIGIYLLIRALGLARPYALVAGSLYLFNPTYMGYHVGTGHVNIINGVTIVPWIGYFLVRPGTSGVNRVIAIGIALAWMIHGGAVTVTAYTVAAVALVYPLYWAPRRGIGRAFGELGAIAAVAMGIAWIKIAPVLDFLPISQRGHGMAPSLAFRHELHYVINEQVLLASVVLALAAIGWIRLFRISRTWFVFASIATALGAAYVFSAPVFEFVQTRLPFLSRMRDPSRSLFLLYLELGLLVSLGVESLARLLPNRVSSAAFGWMAAFAFVCIGFAVAITPATMVDGRARREANPILQAVAADDAFFRLTSYQDRNRHWGYQHQTIPYGIRLLFGYTASYANDFMYSRYAASMRVPQYPFVPRIFENFATMSGLLAVKYVSSMEEVEEPGLRLLAKFPVAREPQPRKSRGPYLYLNERAMPRAYLAGDAILVDGSVLSIKSTILSILADARFRPERITLIAAPEGPAEARAVALERSDRHLSPNAGTADTGRTIAREQLFAPATPRGPVELDVHEETPESLSIELPEFSTGEWIVLSDKFALFNGWKASVESGGKRVDLPAFRANHVNTALWIPPYTTGPLRLSYTSPGFHLGLVVFFGTSAAIAVVAFRNRRRASAAKAI